jgi:hypothetical protein
MDYYVTDAGSARGTLWAATRKAGGRSTEPSALHVWDGTRFSAVAGGDMAWYYDEVAPWLGGRVIALRSFAPSPTEEMYLLGDAGRPKLEHDAVVVLGDKKGVQAPAVGDDRWPVKVWAIDAEHAVAVGLGRDGTRPYAQRWGADARAVIEPLPTSVERPYVTIHALAAPAPDVIYVAGACGSEDPSGSGGREKPIAYLVRRDATGWTRDLPPSAAPVDSVSATSDGAVWLVAEGVLYARSRPGQPWEKLPLPPMHEARQVLALAPDDVWVAAYRNDETKDDAGQTNSAHVALHTGWSAPVLSIPQNVRAEQDELDVELQGSEDCDTKYVVLGLVPDDTPTGDDFAKVRAAVAKHPELARLFWSIVVARARTKRELWASVGNAAGAKTVARVLGREVFGKEGRFVCNEPVVLREVLRSPAAR